MSKTENHTSLTDAVYIGLDIRPFVRAFDTFIHQRKIVVNHHINLENVNPSGNDIGGNQHLSMIIHPKKGK